MSGDIHLDWGWGQAMCGSFDVELSRKEAVVTCERCRDRAAERRATLAEDERRHAAEQRGEATGDEIGAGARLLGIGVLLALLGGLIYFNQPGALATLRWLVRLIL